MKINTLKTLSIILLGCISLNLVICSKSNRGEDGQNHEALAYNDGKSETGLNFSLGSNGGYTLNNDSGFRKVETVDKLPPYVPIQSGVKESAEAIPSQTDYYDGEYGLNAMKINCKIYKDPSTCLHTNQCGWCHANNTCIVGNSMGPLDECPRSRYQFSWPGGAAVQDRIVNNDFGSTLVRTFQRRQK
jgi:hypothetical protein